MVKTLNHVKDFSNEHGIDLDSIISFECLDAVRGGRGFIALDEHDKSNTTTCNTMKDTEKDAAKRNATCGVFAVQWTCGIIIGLSELYGSESKSQVLAYLIALWKLIGEWLPSLTSVSRLSDEHSRSQDMSLDSLDTMMLVISSS